MVDGVVVRRHEGTPQGGPLSPLLANVLLDEVDRALEKSGHAFARYADDCNVYVRSKRAGERVMEHLRVLYAKLRLRVNEDKSAVARAWDRKFLGYSFWVAKGREVKRRAAPKSLDRFKERIRQITSRNGGRSLAKVVEELRSYLLGWKNYFRLADTPGIFRGTRPVDRPTAEDGAAQTVEARDDGLSGVTQAGTPRPAGPSGGGSRPKLVENGQPRGAQHSHAGQAPRRDGPASASTALTSTFRIAGCGPACPVVWEGCSRDLRLPPIPIGMETARTAGSGRMARFSGGRGRPSPRPPPRSFLAERGRTTFRRNNASCGNWSVHLLPGHGRSRPLFPIPYSLVTCPLSPVPCHPQSPPSRCFERSFGLKSRAPTTYRRGRMKRRDFLATSAAVAAGLTLPPGLAHARVIGRNDADHRELAMRALDAARAAGASYADVRIQRNRTQSIGTRERQITGLRRRGDVRVRRARAGERGVGLRGQPAT